MSYLLSVETDELNALAERWGEQPHEQHVLPVDYPFLNGRHQRLTDARRRAEICYVLHRGSPGAGVLLHRKIYYPANALRLPTGGIHQGESVEETLVREVFEETGLTVTAERTGHRSEPSGRNAVVERYLGLLDYRFQHPALGERTFATYHFLVRAAADAPIEAQDEDEQVEEWAWTPAGALNDVADQLLAVGEVDSAWRHWAHYRALSHRFVATALDS